MTNKNRAILEIINDPIINIDLLQHLFDDFVGEGCYRYVFSFGKNRVAKIDTGNVLANASEWDTWTDVKDFPDAAKWFAPVLSCSTAAKMLVMQKADMSREIEHYPTEIPEFFMDIKKANFGFIGNQLVCVDYAINDIRKKGLATFKMKKVIWQQ